MVRVIIFDQFILFVMPMKEISEPLTWINSLGFRLYSHVIMLVVIVVVEVVVGGGGGDGGNSIISAISTSSTSSTSNFVVFSCWLTFCIPHVSPRRVQIRRSPANGRTRVSE